LGSFIDLTGKRFGRLTVVCRAPNHKKQTVWKCHCDCGNIVDVQGGHLSGGKIISCGCYQRENNKRKATKHGQWGTKLHYVWLAMRQRYNNPKCKDYPHWGGRGIQVCSEWNSFLTFEIWAHSHGYREGLTIERKNVNGNYCPENCTWITQAEQMRNTTRTLNNRCKKAG
jgi:hypothetical protein